MNLITSIIIGLILNYYSTQCATYLPTRIAELSVTYPAFTQFIPNRNNPSLYHFAISSFDPIPFTSDNVYYIKNYNPSSNTVQTLNNFGLVWPNELIYTNESIYDPKFDAFGGLVVAGGFLVPTKSNGGLYYYPFTSLDRSSVSINPPILLSSNTQDKVSWFYHRARHVDVSGDGYKDFVTCRTHKPIFGKTLVELVAFVYQPQTSSYNLNIISEGNCDVFFEVDDIDGDGRVEIIAAGFFISKLNLIYSDDPKNSFVNGNIKIITIDSQAGQLFDVGIYNLDNKGNLELLVTNHQPNNNAIKGSVFFYQLNGTVRTGLWERSVIYNNFPVLKSGPNQAAPGVAKAFYPNLNDKTGSPYILVSGDGAENAYLFAPSNDSNALSYKLVWNAYYKGDTVGGLAVADIDNDGYAEFSVPLYEANKIEIYTFKPSK